MSLYLMKIHKYNDYNNLTTDNNFNRFDKSKFIPHENYRDGDIPVYLKLNLVIR